MTSKRPKPARDHGLSLYVSLPGEVIPRKVLDGRLAIEGLSMTMSFADDKRLGVSILRQDPRVHLYALNKPLEEIYVEYASHMNELLVLRNRLMLMAVNLGLADEVPSVKVHTTWPQLAAKILEAISASGCRPVGRKARRGD